jgi:hypothetical protein
MALQLKIRASVRKNAEHDSDMLMFSFHLGPLECFCLAHYPRAGETFTTVYVKVSLKSRSLVEVRTRAVESWTREGEKVRLTKGKAGFTFGPLSFRILPEGDLETELGPKTFVCADSRNVEAWDET